MINQCPFCQQALQFSGVQQEKIDTALAGLKPGAALKLGCPHCRKAISLQADGSLFVETPAQAEAPAEAPSESKPPSPPQPDTSAGYQATVKPPDYPDISWLAQGIYTEQAVMTETPKAMILMPSGQNQDHVAKALSDQGYQTEFPESASDALIQLRFGLYLAVVLHDEFDGDLAESTFHQHMITMPMERRRTIFYALIGKKRHTLYNLEALACSANVVINEAEVPHFDIILKKGLLEMESLFGPYIKARQRVATG